MCILRTSRLIVLFLAFSSVFACTKISLRDHLMSDGVHNVEGYAFDPSSTIEARITEIPPTTLKALMQTEQRNDYLSYIPTTDERRMFAEYCEKLPEANKRVMKESLVRIYFIKNFVGAGMTDFVLSKDRKVYTVLYVNSAVFTKGISEWLTYRENSLFSQGTNNARVAIDCGTQYSALMYLLLHESSHIMDYVHTVTPQIEGLFAEAQGVSGKRTPFVEGVWEDSFVTAKVYGITENRDLHAYGIAPPAIDTSRLREFYEKLFLSPLVSGYSATNWAEDFADSVVFYHLTQKLKQPYSVIIYEKGKPDSVHKPMESPQVQQRWKLIEALR